ncbi:unnamed protein product [Aspergillus oryzae var. brunneus]|uniref:Unnamed protein product n=2 Tax=Aspergillus oryzae TaxID=5062 RepID=A0AAN5BS65_ASPOZ|nr:unnamed protein product [Aspergillus oryzae]GMG42809.1 unnamed protein product [Aspergillus oryzae var. brunneus]
MKESGSLYKNATARHPASILSSNPSRELVEAAPGNKLTVGEAPPVYEKQVKAAGVELAAPLELGTALEAADVTPVVAAVSVEVDNADEVIGLPVSVALALAAAVVVVEDASTGVASTPHPVAALETDAPKDSELTAVCMAIVFRRTGFLATVQWDKVRVMECTGANGHAGESDKSREMHGWFGE